MRENLDYYSRNAREFFDATVAVDLAHIRQRFTARIPAGGLILDAGCGSGRDVKAFKELGYRVRAFDACPELVGLAKQHAAHEVELRSFADVEETSLYDGIWACASLLHVPADDIPSTLGQLWQALKPGGVLYVSFQLGQGERAVPGRRFTDANETTLRQWLENLPEVVETDCWISEDARPGRETRWVNAISRRQVAQVEKVIPGGANHFLPHLCEAIAHAHEIDIAVAFIKVTGLRLLLPDIHAAMADHRNGRVRILTSDYLGITDPDALSLLMLLQQEGADVRVYETGVEHSFHLKAYLFTRIGVAGALHGTAFIGSSNISKQALQDGLEWNYRVVYPGDRGFLEARNRFEELFANRRSIPLSDDWIQTYRARRVPPVRPVSPGSHEAEPPPVPTPIQEEALEALQRTRQAGYRRGLVVMATGLGKTWLAAFDAANIQAKRILFVAHRKEILQQAAETFLRIRPAATVGYYLGQQRDVDVDILCASVQTLGRSAHLERFAAEHFDYVVIDEFHHAAASTYRRLLQHFDPGFLLGLTATPDRTDNSDILSLCDENLVFARDLTAGIKELLLAPFTYFGIQDEEVEYQEIPWRNGKFDPDALASKLATLARSRHIYREWVQKSQTRTLAFCVSIRHADFMAQQFLSYGVRAAAVHGDSALSRGEALEQLRNSQLQVIFSVDLFNEGVDLPDIDTVLLLRPTESKILFLQQIGRGLRRAPGKERLVILDFIGNHKSFLHKPQALLNLKHTFRDLANFARDLENHRLELPEGCFVNFDLRFIDFLKSLHSEGTREAYESLRDTFGRRPTLLEFHRSGADLKKLRSEHGSWLELVMESGDLDCQLAESPLSFLRELETTKMTKSYKMVLLEAFQELDGWNTPPPLNRLAARSWAVLQRRRTLQPDVPSEMTDGTSTEWQMYWRGNPVRAWLGENTPSSRPHFRLDGANFVPAFDPKESVFPDLVQEIVDYRLATYEARNEGSQAPVIPIDRNRHRGTPLPYFPNIQIACGHFRDGRADAEEHRALGDNHGRLDPAKHFIARAAGNSMDGGAHPVRDGDYLLLERITPNSAGSISDNVVVIERQSESGDNQYLLRKVIKRGPNDYLLRAFNLAYADIPATEEFRTMARLKEILPAWEMAIGETIPRELIPPLFGVEFNPGSWNVGHVVLNEQKAHVLLVTLNKRGKAKEHRYAESWLDDTRFQWMSQNQTTPSDKRGHELINHEKLGISIHLFVREEKLSGGKAAPFTYHGPVDYVSHTGSAPMSVTFLLRYPKNPAYHVG